MNALNLVSLTETYSWDFSKKDMRNGIQKIFLLPFKLVNNQHPFFIDNGKKAVAFVQKFSRHHKVWFDGYLVLVF